MDLTKRDATTTSKGFRLDKRRRDCMINQRRYRERKRGRVLQVEEYVRDLSDATSMMEVRASMLRSTVIEQFVQAGQHRCRSISSYLRMFQRGLFQPHEDQFTTQMDLVRGVMCDSLQFNGEVGPDALIRQWKSYTTSFQYLFMRSGEVRAHGTENDIVIAHSTLVLVFTRATLAGLFPHVLAREDIVQRLVGREIEFTLRLSFSFDHARVAVMDANVQMVPGLVRALASIADALFVLEGPQGEAGRYFTPNGLIVTPDAPDVKRRIDFILG
ncbi:hypothetical protein DYB37_001201 [Aphanomyces astaci]|uniref:BZIP domain-containing protein n=1 Tax=Aphanomyces astaci TaxID=112090 RepID=A0A418EZS9_APHAT|nr:hypothetical protein DYB35_000884 [Aphanomyces astaci]RHZ21614.1 hypothetical protein DYB37_001201 [Aphanomyces astaci]